MQHQDGRQRVTAAAAAAAAAAPTDTTGFVFV